MFLVEWRIRCFFLLELDCFLGALNEEASSALSAFSDLSFDRLFMGFPSIDTVKLSSAEWALIFSFFLDSRFSLFSGVWIDTLPLASSLESEDVVGKFGESARPFVLSLRKAFPVFLSPSLLSSLALVQPEAEEFSFGVANDSGFDIFNGN
jgi:hypothetical protein